MEYASRPNPRNYDDPVTFLARKVRLLARTRIARQHKFLMPETDHSHHLLELDAFFADPTICRNSFRLLIHFAIRLAAAGHASDVLTITERSPEAKLFQPLADGLRLHLGLPVQITDRSRVLAIQIAGKIAEEVSAHREAPSLA